MPYPHSSITVPLPKGEQGTIATVKAMADMIRKGSRHPAVRSLAVSIVYPYKTDLEKLDALFRYVQKNVSYVRDNANMEMVHSPAWQITSYNNNGFYHGDCDDHVILLGSMLISVGYPVSLAVVRVGNTPGAMNHVYLETVLKGKWIAMDATKKDSPMGWKPQAARMQRIPV